MTRRLFFRKSDLHPIDKKDYGRNGLALEMNFYEWGIILNVTSSAHGELQVC